MSVAHPFSLLFYSLHLFFTSQNSDYHSGNHITQESEPKSGQLYRQHLFNVLVRTFFVSRNPVAYVGKLLHSKPKSGLSLQPCFKGSSSPAKYASNFFVYCILIWFSKIRLLTPAIHACSSVPPISYCVYSFSAFGEVFGVRWLAAGSDGRIFNNILLLCFQFISPSTLGLPLLSLSAYYDCYYSLSSPQLLPM